ncbi:hypothetical protein [Dactylosporangium sp. CS-033363]|uniref:hypothetical protein n=1 Tax=Dactylosporangium sp. CS-033363 TaxID=3239935 RepID=UPI003D89EBFB
MSELRPELRPRPVPAERIAALEAAADAVIDGLRTGGDVSAAVAAFNAGTGHAFAADDFRVGFDGYDALIAMAAQPARLRVEGITQQELAECVRRVRAADPHTDHYLRVLTSNLPDPGLSDLIFYPPPDLEDATDLEIVEAAQRYRPFVVAPDGTVSR